VRRTNEPLAAVRHLYKRAGFPLAGEGKHRDFGPELLRQEYELDLLERASASRNIDASKSSRCAAGDQQ